MSSSPPPGAPQSSSTPRRPILQATRRQASNGGRPLPQIPDSPASPLEGQQRPSSLAWTPEYRRERFDQVNRLLEELQVQRMRSTGASPHLPPAAPVAAAAAAVQNDEQQQQQQQQPTVEVVRQPPNSPTIGPDGGVDNDDTVVNLIHIPDRPEDNDDTNTTFYDSDGYSSNDYNGPSSPHYAPNNSVPFPPPPQETVPEDILEVEVEVVTTETTRTVVPPPAAAANKSVVTQQNNGLDQRMLMNPEKFLDLFKNLSELLECPVCLELIRPGTTMLGICTRGHILCQVCATRICDQPQGTGLCPSCRCERMTQVTCHYLALSFVEFMTAFTEYKCKYDTCFVQKVGKAILGHEEFCYEKPIMCPKRGCKNMVPYYSLVTPKHSCLKLVKAENPQDTMVGKDANRFVNIWRGILLLKDIYSFDTGREKVSVTYQPWLLLPQTRMEEMPPSTSDSVMSRQHEADENSDPNNRPKQQTVVDVEPEPKKPRQETNTVQKDDTVGGREEFKIECEQHHKMFLNVIESMGGGVVLYISSFESKHNISKTSKDKQFILSAFAHTHVGIIGQVAKIFPVYQGSVIKRNDDGIFLSSEDIQRMILRTNNIKSSVCGECLGGNSLIPHLHIQIKEKKPQINNNNNANQK